MPTIPPLVCNTPPPIDDLESDDDLSAPNDCNDHFDDESLPPSPQQQQQQQKQQNTANTILVRNSLSPSPEMTVTHKPAATNTTAESPISLELELESQIVNDGLDSQSSIVVADDELQFDSDKVCTGSDSAIGDVYSNGQCSNSSIITSKETDTSNSSVDLKRSETLPDNNDHPISAHTTDRDDDDDENSRNEYNCEHALPAIEQSDNLSSSPSWNLDGQTPEPEFNSFSMPGELSSIEHSSTTMIANTEHHTDTLGFADDCHHSNTEISVNDANDEKLVPATSVSPTIVNDSISNANDDDSLSECEENDMGAIKFNADFGQFATFDDEHFNAIASEPAPIAAVATAASTTIEPTNKCDKTQTAFSQDSNESSGEGGHTNNDYDDDGDDDDDDEFGEFNDFQQMPAADVTASASAVAVDTAVHKDVTPSANVLLDSENIKLNLSSILNAIFPAEQQQSCDVTTTAAARTDSDYTYEKRQFINNLTVQLRNVENSTALNHQWAKSTSKTLLVKALGIDSRNILYGEKWNSSAPKFAANLGLSPLEPMKVMALLATSTSTSSSAASAPSAPSAALNAVDNDIKGHKSILEVPAAQFDWNSSGLINPLDALHAHTLLLDLEQLVVVANLDKINLNSSSSACSTTNLAQNYQPSISKSTMPTTSTSTAIATATKTTTSLSSSAFKSQPYQIVSALPMNESKLAKINNQRSTTTPSSSSSSSSLTTSTLDNLNQFNKTNFIKCTNGIHAMRYDTNHVKPLVTGNPFDSYFRAQNSTHEDQLPLDHQKTTQQGPPSKSLVSDLLPQLGSSNHSSPPLSAPVVDTVAMVRSTKLPSLDDVHSEDITAETTSPASDSYSYTVPGSSGTMKETHIFTPVTPKSVANVVGTSIGASGATVAAVPIQPAGPVTTNVTEAIAPSLIPNGVSSQSTCDNEPFQSDTIVIKENVVKKEYRDVEYEPNKIVANASADDFTEFQFAQPTQSMPTSNPTIEQNLNATNVSPNIQLPSMSFNPDIYDKSGQKPMPNDRNANSFESLSSIPSIDTISADASAKPSMNTGNASEFDLYSINKSSFPPSSYSNAVTASNVSTEQFGRATDPMEIFSIQSTQQKQHHLESTFEQSPQSTTKLDTQQPPSTKLNSHNNNYDKNHTNSSSSIPFTNNNNNTVHNSMASISSVNSHPTMYIGGGSSILMPQTLTNNVQSKQTSAVSSALTIQWPEPGINTDQLEQFEARFSIQSDSNSESIKSDTKNAVAKDNDLASSSITAAAADDEWSDFVSVVQPQTPITNILNKNLLKHQNNDEDDWSEFVSSTPAPNSLHQFAPPPQSTLLGINVNNTTANSNYNNVFKPWTTNTTPFPQKNQTASYHPNSTFDGYAKSSNAQRYAKTVNTIANGDASRAFQNVMQKSSMAAPSIISLPDLGFVAPKSLVNMPNRTLAKK